MRWLAAMVWAAWTIALPATAAGQLSETRQLARIDMQAGWATVEVERRFHNESAAPAGWRETLAPWGAVVGMRVHADGYGWLEAALTEPAEAERRFRGSGGGVGVAAALHLRDPFGAELTLGTVAPGQTRTVRYRVLLPTEYRDGKHWIGADVFPGDMPILGSGAQLSALWVDELPAERVTAAHGSLVGQYIGWAPPQSEPLAGALALVGLSDGRALVSCRVHAAPQLSPLPEAAHVVLLIDGSRSIEPSSAPLVTAAVGAYLSELPDDARVAIARFDRRVHPLADGFVPVAEAARLLAGLSTERANGSHLDAALDHAGRLLSAAPRGADKRIVLFGDHHMRHALGHERIAERIPAGALMHSVTVTAGPQRLAPRDDGWNDVFAASGGLAWYATVSGLASDAAALRDDMRELVRPTRLRGVEVADPTGEDSYWLDEVLDEGEGASMAVVSKISRRQLRIRGTLWRRPVALALVPSEAEATRAAAWSLVSGILDAGVGEADRRMLAWRGGALSEHTSFVVATPGSRPSEPELSRTSASAPTRSSGFGGGGFGRVGHRAGSAHEPLRYLAARVDEARARCADHQANGLYLETTLDEIVDVGVDDPSAHRCLLDALWQIALPELFRNYQRLRYPAR